MTSKNSPMGWFSLAIDCVLLMIVFLAFAYTTLGVLFAIFAAVAVLMAERRRRINLRRREIEQRAAAIRTQRIKGAKPDHIGDKLPEVLR